MPVAEQQRAKAGKSFDSLAYAKRMESVGFTRPQAEALAEEQANLIDDRLATKDDVELVRAEVKQAEMRLEAKIAETRAGLEAKIAETNARISESKADIVKWVIGIGFAQTAMILGVLKFHG